MGTKLEYAVNLLTAANSQKISFLEDFGACLKPQTLNKENNFQRIQDLHKLQSSMNRMIDDLPSVESIKRKILQQEDIFKQQVRELHRLYSVQKMLMNQVKYEVMISGHSRGQRVDSSINLPNRHDSSAKVANGFSLNAPVLRSIPSFNEASGSCSGDNMINPGCFDLEKQVYEVNGTKSSINCNRYDEEEVEIELTLSIGKAKNSNKRMKNQQPHCDLDLFYSKSVSTHFEMNQQRSSSVMEEANRGEEYSNSAKSDQDTKRPHWLYRSRSSNKA